MQLNISLQYQQELLEMHERRRARLPDYISSAREEITKLWDEMMVGPRDREAFAGMFEGQTHLIREVQSIYPQRLNTASQRTSPRTF
jgi:hypothetical protein